MTEHPPLLLQVSHLARRSVLRTFRQPINVVPSFLFPLMLLAVNVGGLRSAANLPGFPADSYLDFALAFTFLQGALFATTNAGTDLARDIQTGFLNRLALTPMRSGALLLGQLAGVVTLALLQATLYLTVGIVAGVRPESGVVGVFLIVLLGVLVALAFGAIGAFLALRTGSGEAIQALFPLFFVFLFLSSMNLPRNLIEIDWFRTVTTINPVSYLIEGIRSLIITGWDLQALLLGFGLAIGIGTVALAAAGLGAARKAGALVRSFRSVALAVAWRGIHNAFTNPSILVPSMLFPFFFFTAFAGGLSRVSDVPGFDYPPGYTAFQYVFVFLQSAAFGGIFNGFAIARDFEGGFARRLLLAAPQRTGIIAGYAIVALVRWVATISVVTVVAVLVGMEVLGSGIDLFGLALLGLLVNVAAVLWAAGIAMRFRTLQAGPLMQVPVFLLLFLAPVYVPLDLLEGWIHAVASVNPATFLLEAGRSLLAGDPVEVGIAFAISFGAVGLLSIWALRGLRSAEAAG